MCELVFVFREKKMFYYWNQDLKITEIGTRWRECWNITNEIKVSKNVRLIQYKVMYRICYTRQNQQILQHNDRAMS